MLSFLVTGCSGFIGRRLVRRLVADYGARAVIGIARARDVVVDAQESTGVGIIVADLLDRHINRELPSVDVVFHLAANIDTAANDEQLRVNHVGTRHLLEWLPTTAAPRIVYASSVAVHDRSGAPTAPIREDSPLVPRTAYGRTKLKGEAVVRERGEAGTCTWTILRLPTVYGDGQKPDGLFETLSSLVRKRRLLGRVNWPGRTSIMHVDDVVGAMVDLALSPEAAGEVFCLGSDEAPTVGEIAQAIARANGRPLAPIEMPSVVWTMARRVAWNARCQAAVPQPAKVYAWRLSLMISDGFLVDATKFRRAYGKPTRRLADALS